MKKLEKQIRTEINNDLAEFESSVFNNPKLSEIQKYLKCIRKTPSIPPSIKLNGRVGAEDVAKAELFNKYFTSMFGRKDSTRTEIGDSLLNSLKCTPEDVSLIVRNFNPKKLTGPDNIGNNFLEMCHETLGKSLAVIFQICINKNTYPTCWKVSIYSFLQRGKQSRRQQLPAN